MSALRLREEFSRPRKGMSPIVCAVAVVFLTSACSSVPDAVNPVAWVDAVSGSSDSSETAPPPGADEQFPNLSQVDQQAAAKDNMSGGLSADTAGRQYADSIQRQQEAPQSSLYSEDKPPAAAEPELASPPAPASAPAPAPVAAAPTPPATPAPPVAVAAAPTAADDAAYNVDSGMQNRLAQQLAEIQARAADQGSLIPPGLTFGNTAQQTVIVSSGGVQSAGTSAAFAPLVPGVAGSAQVANQGALPLPSSATRIATILFKNGSAALDARDREILNAVARLQKQNNGTLRVIGHASQRTRNMDQARHHATNLKVSVTRAEQVASALKGLGVAESSILVAAVGDNEPIYAEVMPSGEAGNRRTEIFLSN